jgi:hypothetical protein
MSRYGRIPSSLAGFGERKPIYGSGRLKVPNDIWGTNNAQPVGCEALRFVLERDGAPTSICFPVGVDPDR